MEEDNCCPRCDGELYDVACYECDGSGDFEDSVDDCQFCDGLGGWQECRECIWTDEP